MEDFVFSYDNAKRSFLAQERRLPTFPERKRVVDEFLKDYAELGHMQLVKNKKDTEVCDGSVYYVLYHAIPV